MYGLDLKIQIKYDDGVNRLEQIAVGDWIDLCAAKSVYMMAGKFTLISLGVAMKLPKGYEAHIVPRSSTFSKYSIIQTNGIGIIDSSYNGNGDKWLLPAYALRDGFIPKGSRIWQFRIVKTMRSDYGEIEFEEVDDLGNEDRGGHGSTGT